jgi:hypothetical protein
MDKIGTGDTTTGLCRPVLDKCRRVTYDAKDNYDPKNEVIKNYIQRTMTNISSMQKRIISDYASTCLSDISTCYSQQVAQVSAWSPNANLDIVYKIMQGACRSVALTCAYAVFGAETDKATDGACPRTDVGTDPCIESISEVFYQSLLCPVNSIYSKSGTGLSGTAQIGTSRCYCESGYTVQSGSCIKASN